MKNIYDRTWKIGELARMFDINVQLLRHYDKEGLLIPEIRNPDNNWRTYSYDQIYPLGMIRLLRSLGCSLDEIGDFMKGRNIERSEAYLRERMEDARAQYKRLFNMEKVLNDRFSMIEQELRYAEANQIFIYSEDEIRFINVNGNENRFVDESFYLYPTLVFYRGDEKHYAVRVPEGEYDGDTEGLHVIPPDEYLVAFHIGPYEKIYETFDRMTEEAPGLLGEGCTIGDTMICIDIIDQFIESDKNNYVTKILTKIYKANEI
ncbi:MAG: MerR family transcriptional regulator [Mogibacterium sp.]|nr:MerR family transcriptional regulator [Mogibacterium sp.]